MNKDETPPPNAVKDYPGVGFIVGKPGAYRFYLYNGGTSRGGYSNVGLCEVNMEMHHLTRMRSAAGLTADNVGVKPPDKQSLRLASVYLCGVSADGAQVQQWANDHLVECADRALVAAVKKSIERENNEK